MPLHQHPPPEDAPEGKCFPSSLGHRGDFLREYFLKEIKHALAVEKPALIMVLCVRGVFSLTLPNAAQHGSTGRLLRQTVCCAGV